MVKRFIILTLFLGFAEVSYANYRHTLSFTRAEIINENTTRIPFKIIDKLIVIEAELMDRKGDFIIDTGSETLILNKSHFPVKHKFPSRLKQTSGAIDQIENVYEKQIDEFVLKEFFLSNVESDVLDLSHIEVTKKMKLLGIIGFSILKDYEVFIDLYLNQITLTKIDEQGNTFDPHVYLEKIADSVDFTLKKHTIVLTCQLGDNRLKFALDSGAEFGQINKNVGREVLTYFYPGKRIRLTGPSGKSAEVVAGKLHRLRLSKTVFFCPLNTVLTNLNNMNDAYGISLDGVLGYDFFRQKRTIINYKKERLYFIDYPLIRQ